MHVQRKPHRLALGMHVFQFIAARLLGRTEVVNIPRDIPTESLVKAIDNVNYLEGQKDIFLEVSFLSHYHLSLFSPITYVYVRTAH